MKKIMFLAVMAMFLLACSSNQKKAEQSVQTYLEENLNDPKSYESIEFGKLDSIKGYKEGDAKKWVIFHSYRAANAFGAKMKFASYFELNNDFKVVHRLGN